MAAGRLAGCMYRKGGALQDSRRPGATRRGGQVIVHGGNGNGFGWRATIPIQKMGVFVNWDQWLSKGEHQAIAEFLLSAPADVLIEGVEANDVVQFLSAPVDSGDGLSGMSEEVLSCHWVPMLDRLFTHVFPAQMQSSLEAFGEKWLDGSSANYVATALFHYLFRFERLDRVQVVSGLRAAGLMSERQAWKMSLVNGAGRAFGRLLKRPPEEIETGAMVELFQYLLESSAKPELRDGYSDDWKPSPSSVNRTSAASRPTGRPVVAVLVEQLQSADPASHKLFAETLLEFLRVREQIVACGVYSSIVGLVDGSERLCNELAGLFGCPVEEVRFRVAPEVLATRKVRIELSGWREQLDNAIADELTSLARLGWAEWDRVPARGEPWAVIGLVRFEQINVPVLTEADLAVVKRLFPHVDELTILSRLGKPVLRQRVREAATDMGF